MTPTDPFEDLPDRQIVRVMAPDARRLSPADVRRMLGGQRPHHARGGGLERGRQMVAMRGETPVGVAAFEIEGGDLLVYVLAAAALDEAAVPALVGALELACLAAGGGRVTVSAHVDVDVRVLTDLGYDASGVRPGWLSRRVA